MELSRCLEKERLDEANRPNPALLCVLQKFDEAIGVSRHQESVLQQVLSFFKEVDGGEYFSTSIRHEVAFPLDFPHFSGNWCSRHRHDDASVALDLRMIELGGNTLLEPPNGPMGSGVAHVGFGHFPLVRLPLGGRSFVRGDYDCRNNGGDAANRLHPSGCVLAELNLSGESEKYEGKGEASGYKRCVEADPRPVESLDQFHVDCPGIRAGSIPTPEFTGECC